MGHRVYRVRSREASGIQRSRNTPCTQSRKLIVEMHKHCWDHLMKQISGPSDMKSAEKNCENYPAIQ